jgi:hypothetical protein
MAHAAAAPPVRGAASAPPVRGAAAAAIVRSSAAAASTSAATVERFVIRGGHRRDRWVGSE